MEHGVVIIGGSIAGYNVAKTLRKEGYPDKITIVNQQGTLPYDLSTLSKDWMLDQEDLAPPLFEDDHFYANAAITVKLNTVITTLNPEDKTILTSMGEKNQRPRDYRRRLHRLGIGFHFFPMGVECDGNRIRAISIRPHPGRRHVALFYGDA